ncbi:amidohydrolase family protein [Pontibacter sp. E15-1]|uniref:amidohydrolase family protein n=1 Tax=Pontibacter sp. E15-1 TaxID=2919918 RepID=UPI001F4F31A5|nr:amidohydrolase family protein [Pontibacter sp. E15-1]MCJ8164326.1 amidohydrolase family protein [Pontibacter sp. E15-1]
MLLDSHQHFWVYDPQDFPWISDEMRTIRRDFLPQDLAPELQAAGYAGCIAVQARQSLEENNFLLGLAAENDFIKGVVGWVDLRSAELDSQLRQYAAFPKFKGVRHVVQDEPDDSFMLLERFTEGIARLSAYNLTYDLLVFPRQLPAAIQLVRQFPEQPFVLDHIAKPDIKNQQIETWKALLQELARNANVSCKLSGMVTEAAWHQWEKSDFDPFLDVVLDAFGEDRLMVGSDWPVCLLAADSYSDVMHLVEEKIGQKNFSAAKILGGNACAFYNINQSLHGLKSER